MKAETALETWFEPSPRMATDRIHSLGMNAVGLAGPVAPIPNARGIPVCRHFRWQFGLHFLLLDPRR